MSDKPLNHTQEKKKDVKQASRPAEKTAIATVSPPASPEGKKKKKRWPWGILMIVTPLLLLILVAGYLLLRTKTFYTWAPLITRSQAWNAALSLEKENTEQISVSLQKLTRTPLTPAEVQIQKQELALLLERNKKMDSRWEEILSMDALATTDRIPDIARHIDQRMRTYVQESRVRLDADQVTQDRLTRAIGIQEKIDRFLVSKADPALAGTDVTAIQSIIDALRANINEITQAREQLEKDLGSPLDGLRTWGDAQWAYLDALQEFYRSRSSSLSVLKSQELLVREKESAIKNTDPYKDLDTIDRLIGTDTRNTLQEHARIRKEQWSQTMRWWRWPSMAIRLMRS